MSHHEMPFWKKYIFSTDHKVIGLQYGITATFFLLFGFFLMILMRWQLAYPGVEIPLIGKALTETGALTPELYNALGAMHGTIMIFLGVVPMGVGAFGNYLVPLQVGACDMAFPKLNMMSYWVYFVGGVIMMMSFLMPGGAAASGWTSYPPLSVISNNAQTVWLLSMVFLITSSLLGSVNTIVTAIQLRAKGLNFMRWPIHVWAQVTTAFLLLLAFPPLEGAAILQLADRVFGSSFFLPSGLVVSGEKLGVAGGGNPLLWQHLFWFLAHPEVYVLILPAVGVVCEIVTTNCRKPFYGYKTMVYSILFLGFMSFVVWAHHMFMTGMGVTLSSFFQATTMIISIPSVIILTTILLTLWGASIRFTVPMLFAMAFLPMFAIGGLTGLPLGLTASDIHLHDTYYVIGHFHYVVAPGTLFALMGGVYYWYPKFSGRHMNEFLGKLHFWVSFVAINFVFMPMFLMGSKGVSRRMYDQTQYSYGASTQSWNVVMSTAAFVLLLAQIPFIWNMFTAWKTGKKVQNDNPWEATTLEWAASSPPPHENFPTPVEVYRNPYSYSATTRKVLPQFIPQEG
ncbi:MAG: cytochrome C oxidase subunit I [Proteobacteria bacterium]|nr:cytochrome C oxidase subunit I [Pseudomonadota bacterium]